MRLTKKWVAAAAAAALTLTSLPAVPAVSVQAADSVDQTVRLQPWNASTFNDTNGDGLGEFEGWGTSLCWWANRIGYSDALTSQAAELFFSDEGLDMNIGRYNVGGGDATGEVQKVPVNENAQFYDLTNWGTNPTGAGSSMSVDTYTKMQDITYSVSDADFGLTKGEAVGSFQKIGWINKLDDEVGSGDNLRYTVEVDEAGTYTVKLMMTLEGTNDRDVAIRVNEGENQADYVVDADTVNSSIVAEGNSGGSNCMLFIVTIPNVELQAGVNTINIAGKNDWTLDFVKMAVIKSGEEGVLPAEDEFTHAEHIIRSDSGVPGYATDVTKIDLDQHPIEWYEENFARADAECGYAWNYDWDADANQMNILKAAAAASGEDFIAEAFSNSPPYFMTVSGCSSGNTNSNVDNLREDSVNAFAAYMADVIEHWNNEGVITFQSTTPMNEPNTNYWGAYSNKQEGCHFDPGESQSRIIEALNAELEQKGINIIISGTDETSIDTQIDSYNQLSDEAKQIVDRIDTHTYSGSDRAGLKSLAESEGKNLWMSEVDGAYTAGTNAGEMSAALGLAQRMMTDVNGLGASAWILWNAIDMHADSSEYGQSWVNKGSANDYLSMDALEAAWQSRSSNGYWGLAAADHDNEEIVLSMKYYGYGQFSRYIRPGYTIIGSSRGNVLSAYDPEENKAVIVALNTSDEDKTWKFDLSGFETMGSDITAIRTSGTMDDGEKWADVTSDDNIEADTENRAFTATMKANSITTYIVEGVNGIREDAGDETEPAVSEIAVSADQVTGGKVWNNGTTNTPQTVIDGNYGTFYDGVDADDGTAGYVMFDLGEAKEIAAFSYAPRSGFSDRMIGAVIYGSDNGEDWTPIYTIDSAPAQGSDTFVYYRDFNDGKTVTYRYVKIERASECNISEFSVYELAGTFESQKAVTATTWEGSEPKLPETVEVTMEGGETKEVPVNWDLSSIDVSWDEMDLYDCCAVTGTSSEVNGALTGYILCAPDGLEYLIDCMSGDTPVPRDNNYNSEVWAAAAGLDSLLNKDSSDQAKTEDNTWGLTTDPAGLNTWAYDQGSTTPLYSYGYWANSDVSITYDLTLPAGSHKIMLGGYDFWSSRTMDVYYSVDGGEKELLCTLTTSHDSGSSAEGTITLNEDAVVTLSVENGGDGDPVLGWISVNAVEESDPAEEYLAAHYDMSHEGSALKDISGNGNDATLYNTEDTDFAAYGEEEVLQFNNEQYATIPSGVIGDAASFTVQAVVSAPTTSDNWLWCFGDGIGEWGAGNIGDYIFVSPNSGQSSYNGTVLAAVKVGSESAGGESRMPVPSEQLGGGYTAITLVSDGTTLTMYMDGVEVSTLEHGKDVSSVIPDGDILGYIGQSLYSPDKKLIANVSDIRIWDTALDANTVASAAPTAEDKTNMLLSDIQDALLNGNASVDEITSDVAFPASVDGVDLTWDVPENGPIAEDGTVTAPASDEQAEVTVSYTCYGEESTATFALNVVGENIDEILDAAAEELDIPNKDDVRGNITLPETTDSGVTITWETSHPEIVDVESHEASVEGYDAMPAGVVTRPSEDTEVTMTATLTYKENTRTKVFTLNVKAAPEEISEDDYTDYFFAYFAGEGYSDGEQIYFASSQDGLNWDDLNNNEPVLTSTLGEEGVRDPFIIRSPEGDKFYLIATDLKIYGGNGWTAAQEEGSQSLMVWESTDLVNWSGQRMVEVSADIGAGCTWAPEATYDPLTGEYVVYWASKVSSDGFAKQRVYYAKTRDFYTFTEPQLYIEKDQSSIDTTMIENDGTYYRYTKNEGDVANELGALTKTIFIEKSSSVLGEFTQIPSDSLNSENNQWVEGPTIFKLNSDDAAEDTWCLLVDDFGGIGYYPLLTTDLESGEFTAPEEGTFKMPSRARHGTPLRVTAEEYARIMAAYGSPEEVDAVTVMGETPDLPDTVTINTGSEELQKAVTWNLDGVSFEGNPYSYVTVTGTVEGSTVEAIANVQIIPANIEYMIDCNNLDSETWKRVAEASSGLLNTEAADQAKTDDNPWGYTSIVGSDNSADMTGFSQSSVSNPYTGGWWARGGKNITYQVTLPAGDHQIMLGCTGWWSMGRQMDVYYSVNGGTETKLCDFDAVNSQETYASGTITLDEEALVTLTVKKAANDDPILSWISVCGTPKTPEISLENLQNAVNAANALAAEDYTSGSYQTVKDALDKASAQLSNPTSQEEVDAAADALNKAIEALVDISDLKEAVEKYADLTADAYTEESFAAYKTAYAEAEAVLGKADVTQEEVDAAKDALEEAVSGLTEKPETVVSKDALQTLYDEVKDMAEDDYTAESWKTFAEALENAAAVLKDENADQASVDAAYNTLQAAADALQKKPSEPGQPAADKDKLQNLYDTNKNIEQGNYTDASYQAYKDALKAAQAVLEDPDATQKEVSKAYSDLLDAIKGLTDGSVPETSGKPDKSDKNDTDGAVQTGDNTPIVAAVCITIAAALAAVVCVLYKKKRKS